MWWEHLRFTCSAAFRCESESCSVVSNSLWPHWPYSPWNFPGQNTRVGSHSLLQVSSQPRDWTQVSCIVGGFFTIWATWESLKLEKKNSNTIWSSSSTSGYIYCLSMFSYSSLSFLNNSFEFFIGQIIDFHCVFLVVLVSLVFHIPQSLVLLSLKKEQFPLVFILQCVLCN